MLHDYELVIGLETHVQLLTASKLFCACATGFTLKPNINVCPVCLGLPGSLPVLNRQAVALALRAALALNCRVPNEIRFDRKHYYYPDLPKNYQISQYEMPLAVEGWLDISAPEGEKRIRIRRAHLEEDAGKLLHGEGGSLVDLNRAGTPLLEIVTEPDLRTPVEARVYLEELRRILLYAGVSDCNMEEGNLRCDANISLRRCGETRLGVKNEIKNMNSFRGVERALMMVAEALAAELAAGEEIRQATWGYSIEKDRIFQLRAKEEAEDYRYFPEPDLPPLRIAAAQVEDARRMLPEMPRARQKRFETQYGLSAYDAAAVCCTRATADYFETTVQALANDRELAMTSAEAAKEAANWIANDLAREMAQRQVTIEQVALTPLALADLIAMVRKRVINLPTGRSLLSRLIASGGSPSAIVAAEGLAQVADAGALRQVLEEIVAQNPKQAQELQGGKIATAMWFFGQVMRSTGGKADPAAVAAALGERFGFDPALLQKKKK